MATQALRRTCNIDKMRRTLRISEKGGALNRFTNSSRTLAISSVRILCTMSTQRIPKPGRDKNVSCVLPAKRGDRKIYVYCFTYRSWSVLKLEQMRTSHSRTERHTHTFSIRVSPNASDWISHLYSCAIGGQTYTGLSFGGIRTRTFSSGRAWILLP